LALVERQERLEDTQKRANDCHQPDDGHHPDDVAAVSVHVLVRFGPYPPAFLIFLDTNHDVGETGASFGEE
jgi:hypothetical protein